MSIPTYLYEANWQRLHSGIAIKKKEISYKYTHIAYKNNAN